MRHSPTADDDIVQNPHWCATSTKAIHRRRGTARQAKLAAQFALDMQQSNIGYLDELLLDLRNSLRRELELEQLSEGSRVMRFYNKEGENPVVTNERSAIDAAEEKQK